jgi:hypothetical protein
MLGGCSEQVAEQTRSEVPACLQLDERELSIRNANDIFNGDIELGDSSKPVPGFLLRCFLTPEAALNHPEINYFPVTAVEADGNRFMQVPTYKGLTEYNLQSENFYVDQDGEATLSFRVKYMPDADGVYHGENQCINLDFRCFNHNVTNGPVNLRYPVLFARSLHPGREWETLSYKIELKGSYFYQFWLRHTSGAPGRPLNRLCVDDIKLTFAGKKDVGKDQVVIAPDRLVPAYNINEKVSFNVRACLRSDKLKENLQVYLRSDYSEQLLHLENLTLARVTAPVLGKAIYVGKFMLKTDRYGSFNAVVARGDEPLFCKGGDFAVIHPVSKTASPLQAMTGCHYMPQGILQQIFDNSLAYHTLNGFDQMYELIKISGLRTVHFNLGWKQIMPKKNQTSAWAVNKELDLLGRYGLEPLACLGGALFRFPQEDNKTGHLKGALPEWMYRDYTRVFTEEERTAKDVIGGLREKSVVPGDDIWRNYVSFVVNTFGKRIKHWTVLGEPQWGLTPEEYMNFLKPAYEIIKKQDKNSVILGGDATSDYGHKLTAWIEELEKLGLSKYCDSIAFNPYGSALNSQKGQYFRFTNLIDKLRETSGKEKPLFMQECFYIPSGKFKQGLSGTELATFAAADVQRHYLNGFLEGLAGMTPIDAGSLLKNDRSVPMNAVPSDALAGLNTLSYFMENMTEVRQLPINKFLRVGIFRNAHDRAGTGVIWDLKGKGTVMDLSKAKRDGVCFYDTYGNPLQVGAMLALTLDPLFLRGNPDQLENLFRTAGYSFLNPIVLRGRKFDNCLYAEAQNRSGSPLRINVRFENAMPPIRFTFNDSDYNTVSLPHPRTGELNYLAAVDREESEKGKVELLEDTGCHVVAGQPLELTMDRGTKLKLTADAEALTIVAEVKDLHITPAPDGDLWKGDALEVFVDQTPFYRLDIDNLSQGNELLAMKQYIFAAQPNAQDKRVMLLDRLHEGASSAAHTSVKINGAGYELKVVIPLAEIRPLRDSDGIIGLNFELCSVDPGKEPDKEFLAGRGFPSYKYRARYPLLKLAAAGRNNLLQNSGFENGTAGWRSPQNSLSANEKSFAGKTAGQVLLPEKPEWGPDFVRGSLAQDIELAPGKYEIGAWIAGENIELVKIALGIVPEKRKPDICRREFKLKPASDAWEYYTCRLEVSADAKAKSLYVEFLGKRGAECRALLDEVRLVKVE